MKEQNVYEIKVGQIGGIMPDMIIVQAVDFPAAFEKAQKYCKCDDFEEEPEILSIEYLHTLAVI